MRDAVNVKVAGFGGQGVMMFGQILAYSATKDGINGLWFPSYGPETRGGTANCSVIVSEQVINSPVFKNANHLIIFNLPSLDKFRSNVSEGGLILYNSSLIAEDVKEESHLCIGVPINDIAIKLGNAKVANMVMMGAYLELTHLFSDETILAIVKKILGEKKADLVEVNYQAIEAGKQFVKDLGVVYAS
ncbi:MAG: 2-oxoacid:acceptor oxidoreductase family protein [Bacilli bacterium]|nr:2-oxoacid:acceptor oxidoreductase family protein [Bacilli bacterium]MBN2877599.1 2-oxoacid:acceptor oxidoreductase family protein [Bacilli bacterium]